MLETTRSGGFPALDSCLAPVETVSDACWEGVLASSKPILAGQLWVSISLCAMCLRVRCVGGRGTIARRPCDQMWRQGGWNEAYSLLPAILGSSCGLRALDGLVPFRSQIAVRCAGSLQW